jgi:hypothetical protein
MLIPPRFVLLLAAGWLLGLPGPVPAALVEDLYAVRVAVPGADEASRLEAKRTALARVLVRVSGDTEATLAPGLADALAGPDRYVQQFGYEARPVASGEQAQRLFLAVTFDPAAVDKLLRGNGLPVWGRNRPATLAWLVVQDGGGREPLGSDDAQGRLAPLLAQAERRGAPMVLPLLDLEDRARLSPAELWAGFAEPVLEASRRYGAEAVLTGRLSRLADGRWVGRWVAYLSGEQQRWEGEAADYDGLLAAAVDRHTDWLVGHYTGGGGTASPEVSLEVSGIGDLDAYLRVTDLLNGLAPVLHLAPVRVAADRVAFRVELHGSEQALMQAIELSGLLRREAPAATPGPGAPLAYTLVP